MALFKNLFTYLIQRYHFDPSARTIVVEASELGLEPGVQPMQRIYDDAIDEGIKIRNVASGQETVWYFTEADTDDGDIAGWRFKPTPEAVWKHPNLEGWTLLIIND